MCRRLDDNDFGTVEHELVCWLRKFSVSTDHGSDPDLTLSAIERANIKRITGTAIHVAANFRNIRVWFQKLIRAEIADEYLRVVQHNVTLAVDDRYRISRLRLVRFQVCDRNTHVQFLRQCNETAEEAAFLVNSGCRP